MPGMSTGMGLAIAGGVGGIGSMAGGIISGQNAASADESAAQTSANEQLAAAQLAANTQLQMYYQGRTDQLPVFRGEEEAFGQYLYGMGENVPNSLKSVLPEGWSPTGAKGAYTQPYTYQQYQNSPYYQYQTQQMLQNTRAAGAGTGQYGSGNMGQSIAAQSANLASQNYLTGYGMQQTDINRMASLAGMASTTSQALGSQASTTGAQVGNTLLSGGLGAGSALLSGGLSAANALYGSQTNAFNQLGSMSGNMMNYAMLQNMMNSGGYGGGAASGTDYTEGIDSGLYYF